MTASNDIQKTRRAAIGLLVTSAAMTGLAIFQWIELVVVRRGGTAVCTVNETVNCETVWNSILAEQVHHLLGVPVAALGLVWGLTALVQAVRLWVRIGRAQPVRPVVPALRVVGTVGLLACILFAYGSFQAHALCLTCLGTYVLVIAFVLIAFASLPGPLGVSAAELSPAIFFPLVTALVAYGVLLIPGRMTPKASAADSLPQTKIAADPSGNPQPNTAALVSYLATLSPQDRMQLGVSLDGYRRETPAAAALSFTPRAAVGNPHAPVRILDFTDVKCPHCRHLEEALKTMRATLPAGSFSVESRYFPLDNTCNPNVTPGMDASPRCVGAKAQICLEKDPALPDVQGRLFDEQESLTPARVLEIATTATTNHLDLERCVTSEETAKKLTEDIQLANVYQLKGTPLVVINGRSAGSPMPQLLYVLALAGGDANNPALDGLMQTPAPAATPAPAPAPAAPGAH